MELLEIVSEFSYIIEMLLACLVFTLPLKQRPYGIPGFLLGAAVSLVASMMLGTILRDSILMGVVIYLIQLALVLLPVWMCCAVSLSDAVYGTLCAYAMQHFASSLYLFVCAATGTQNFVNGMKTWVDATTVLLYLAVYVGVYVTFYWLFAKPLADHGEYRVNSFQSGSLTMLVVPIALILSLIGKITYVNGPGFLIGQVYAMLCSVFVLWVQVSQRKAIRWQRELAAQEQIWKSQKEQYQLSKAQIELINQKCHDLKHQVAALRTIHDEQQREDSIRKVEQAVMIYDAAIHTGNEVLDTVLTEKSLTCERKEIKWTCMADGSQLGFLDPVDLYAIFGNALDNAIEAVQELTEPEQRVIAVTVFNRGKLTILQIENYYNGQLTFQDGLPKSTKGDDDHHGFGMKSIRQIAEKYSGSISIHTEDGIFVLSIILPVPDETA